MKSNHKLHKFLLLFLVFQFAFTVSIWAQQDTVLYKRNAIYFELLGQGGLYSINYDVRLTQNLSLRAGITSWQIGVLVGKFRFTAFPVMLNYLSGKRDSHLELGVGLMPAHFSFEGTGTYSLFNAASSGSSNAIIGTATVGYRYQPLDGGFVFRIGLTPFIANGIRLYGGISGGIAF